MKSIQTHAIAAILIMAMLVSCSLKEKETNPTSFMSPLSICVYGKKVSDTRGDLNIAPGDFIPWKGNGSLSWEVEIKEKDDYEFYIIANVGEAGAGTRILVQTEKEEERARNARASVDWLVEAGYGLMFHWTSQSVQPDGSIKPYKDAVEEFDVERFAAMVEETGAGYVLLTIGHAESYCPAPIGKLGKDPSGAVPHSGT